MSDIQHKTIIKWVPKFDKESEKEVEWKGEFQIKKYGYKARAALMRKYPIPLDDQKLNNTSKVADMTELMGDLAMEVVASVSLKHKKEDCSYSSVEEALDDGVLTPFLPLIMQEIFGSSRPTKK